MSPAVLRPAAGTRPPVPVRQEEPPDDWHCTWSYVLPVWSQEGPKTGVWELKYIHAACPVHSRLRAA